NATRERVERLVRRITFSTTSPTPSASVTVRIAVEDGDRGSGSDQRVIVIDEVNDPPIANDDPGYTLNEGGTLNVSATMGVLANDTDPDNAASPLNAGLMMANPRPLSGPSHGTLTLNADGSFTYSTTDPDFFGTDTFTYRATDGEAESNA